jgi:hypothetical protein
MKQNTLNFTILILVAITVSWYVNVKAKEAINEFETIGAKQNIFDTKKLSKNVVMISPKKGEEVSSPVKISGSVSGRWFFEGTIIGKVTNSEGEVLGQGPLMANGDWMTESNVSFEGIIPFGISNTKNGFIVIEADDPGGTGNIPSYKMPIVFGGNNTTFCTGPDCGNYMCNSGSMGSNGVCIKDPEGKGSRMF